MSIEAQMKVAVILSAYDRMTATVNKAVNSAHNKLKNFANKADTVAAKSFQTGQQLIASGLAVAAPLYKAIDAATEFETKMVDIRKQMNEDTPETVGAMSKEIQLLARTVPLATGEIQDMIANGMKMGVAQNEVVEYTRQVSKMSIAFDMAAGEISEQMGIISNVYDIPIKKIGEFADTINYLDDKAKGVKGTDLIGVLTRIGGAARNLHENSAAALAASMLSLGETEETAGTAISGMLNSLSAAGMKTGKFQEGLRMIGMEGQKVQQLMSDKKTAEGTLIQVLERINKLDPSKQTEAYIRLFGADHGPKIMKLGANMHLLHDNLKLVNGQQKGSMDAEYQKRVASSAAQMQMFKNRIQELWVKVGNSLLPALNKLLPIIGSLVEKVGNFITNNPKFVSGLGMAAAAFSAIAIVGGYLSFVFSGVAKFVGIVSRAIGFLTKAFRFIMPILRIVWFLIKMFPIVRIIMLIILAAVLIIKYWTQIKQFFIRLWDAVTGAFVRFWNWLTGFSDRFRAAGKNIIMSIVNGIKSAIGLPFQLIKKMVSKIRNLLPFSPAKEGPLQDIHRVKFVETIASSIKPASLIGAMKKVAGAARKALFGPVAGSVSGPGASGGTTVNININLSGGANRADAAMVLSEAKKQFAQWMKQHNNQQARITFG